MELQSFTSNFEDKSTDAGFQFVFFCDICGEGYKTEFVESETYSKKGLFQTIANIASSILMMFRGRGTYRAGWGLRRGARAIGGKTGEESPEWHKEYEEAFELAQNEAKDHFHRCPNCQQWVCESDWNEQKGLCLDDAPREDVEVASAEAQKTVEDIKKKASQTQAFTGEIEEKQTICPSCGKPAGQGNYCNNCGESLELVECEKCGAENPAGTNFCGECGTSI